MDACGNDHVGLDKEKIVALCWGLRDRRLELYQDTPHEEVNVRDSLSVVDIGHALGFDKVEELLEGVRMGQNSEVVVNRSLGGESLYGFVEVILRDCHQSQLALLLLSSLL
jgi:hypothetical protein